MTLPLLVAGPILRRAEPKAVCIWLATSARLDVRAEVFLEDDSIGSSDPARGGSETTIGLGDRLFVNLLEVRPPEGRLFPRDRLLLYDVTVGSENLAGLGLKLAYDTLRLPSFFLPSTLSTLIYGSCRRPHSPAIREGAVAEDCLAAADELIQKAVLDLGQRPAVLFLTGDQIYADNVAAPLLPVLSAMGDKLTGWQETIPNLGKPIKIPLFGRAKALKEAESGLTSDDSESHLLTFGEFAAMYLVVWGGLERTLPQWEDIKRIVSASNQERRASTHQIYNEQRAEVEKFIKTLPKVRRVLANIATYMIFDDHEVSDDWNLNGSWYEAVSKSPSGRRVVANALAAYWAFQAWGNYPAAFSRPLIDAIEAHLNAKVAEGITAKHFEEHLWNWHSWGYSVPTNPPAIVLDTRTQRQYDSKRGPARLMNRDALDWLRATWEELQESREYAEIEELALIIVCPTPVYGFEPVELLQKLAVAFGKNPFKVDFESWIANRQGFGSFMRTLNTELRPRWCLFLSGDVHYAFTTRAEFESDGQTLKIWQMTSSPLKNQAQESDFLAWLSSLTARTERRFGWLDNEKIPLYYRLFHPLIDLSVRWNLWRWDSSKHPIWRDTVSGIPPENGQYLLVGDNNLGLVYFLNGEPLAHKLQLSVTEPSKVKKFWLTS